MDIGYILKRAWEIIWKFKILWIFGILASCGQANGGGGNINYTFSGGDINLNPQIEQFFNRINTSVSWLIIAAVVLLIFAIIVLSILLTTVGKAGLIKGTLKAEQGSQKLSFGELWHDALGYFWRLFGLNLLVGAVIFVVVLLLMIPGIIFAIATKGIGALCLIPLACIMIPVFWLVSVFVEFSNVALVVDNLSITDAIGRGWKVIRENFGNAILISVILLIVIGGIGGFIIGLPLVAILGPLFLGLITGTNQALQTGSLISVVLFVLYLPILWVLSGILKTYTTSAWTLTYMRLTNKPAPQPVEGMGTPPVINVTPTSGV